MKFNLLEQVHDPNEGLEEVVWILGELSPTTGQLQQQTMSLELDRDCFLLTSVRVVDATGSSPKKILGKMQSIQTNFNKRLLNTFPMMIKQSGIYMKQ